MSCHQNIGRSVIHRLDPRLKIVAALAWSFLLALSTTRDAALAGLAGSALLVVTARLAPVPTLKRLGVINVFIVFLWLMLPFSFSTPGQIIAAWGPLEVTREGVALALLLTIKANGVALGALALLGTSPILDLAAAARRLGAPEKLTAMFLLMIRYFEVIRQEYSRLRVAMRMRGFRPGMNLHTYRTLANLVGMLLVRSLDRAERVHAAMLCRGYNGRFWIDGQFAWKRLDWAVSFCLLMLASVVLGLDNVV